MAIDGMGSKLPPLTPPTDLEPPTPKEQLVKQDGELDAPPAANSLPAGSDVSNDEDIPKSGDAGKAQGSAPVGGVTPQAPAQPVVNVAAPPVSLPTPTPSPLDRPKLVIPSAATSLSIGDLIILVQQQIQKTSEALASAQNSAMKADALKQQAAATSQIEALNDAADQILEIQKMQEDIAIANWCMFALAVFMTVCTAGSLGVIFGPLMVAGTVLTQVPIEGKNVSGWLTEGIGEGIGLAQKAMLKEMVVQGLKDRGIDPSTVDLDQMLVEANDEIEANQDYYAMAILITLQVCVAIIITAATLGSGTGQAVGGATVGISSSAAAGATNAATNAANSAANAASQTATQVAQTVTEQTTKVVKEVAEQTVKTAVDLTAKVAQEAVQKSSEVATQATTQATTVATNLAKNAADAATKGANTASSAAAAAASTASKAMKAFTIIKEIGTVSKDLALDGVNIHTAILQYENSETLADADKIKGYIKFLQNIMKNDQEFLSELLEMQANIAETTRGILQTEHSTNMRIANLTTHA